MSDELTQEAQERLVQEALRARAQADEEHEARRRLAFTGAPAREAPELAPAQNQLTGQAGRR